MISRDFPQNGEVEYGLQRIKSPTIACSKDCSGLGSRIAGRDCGSKIYDQRHNHDMSSLPRMPRHL